jgi:transposase
VTVACWVRSWAGGPRTSPTGSPRAHRCSPDRIEFVAIDPSAAYAAAVRAALPGARLVVDHLHLVKLANDTVTKVRRRVSYDATGHRGRKTNPEWTNRRRLLTAREHLSDQRFAQMWDQCMDADESDQIIAAWIAKEQLRALLATAGGGNRSDIAHHKHRFHTWCAIVDISEVTTLAETIQTWWPEIEAFCRTRITNARTEGTNRLIKEVGRRACKGSGTPRTIDAEYGSTAPGNHAGTHCSKDNCPIRVEEPSKTSPPRSVPSSTDGTTGAKPSCGRRP